MQAVEKLRRREELIKELRTAQPKKLASVCAELRDALRIKEEIIGALAADDIERAEKLFEFLEGRPGKMWQVFLPSDDARTLLKGSDESVMWAAVRIAPGFLYNIKKEAFNTCRAELTQKLRILDSSNVPEVISTKMLASRDEKVSKFLDWVEKDKRANLTEIIANAYGTGQKDIALRVEKMSDPATRWHDYAAIAAIESGNLKFAQWALQHLGVDPEYLARDHHRRFISAQRCDADLAEWFYTRSETLMKRCFMTALHKGNLDTIKVLYERLNTKNTKNAADLRIYMHLHRSKEVTEWIVHNCGIETAGKELMRSVVSRINDPDISGNPPSAKWLADLAEKAIGDPAKMRQMAAELMVLINYGEGTAEDLLWLINRFGVVKEDCRETLDEAAGSGRIDIIKCLVEKFGPLDGEQRRTLYLTAIERDEKLTTIEFLYKNNILPPNPQEILETVLAEEFYSSIKDTLALEWFVSTFGLKIIYPVERFRVGMSGNYLRWLLEQAAPSASALKYFLGLAVEEEAFETADIIAEYYTLLVGKGKDICWDLRVACGRNDTAMLNREFEKIMALH